MQKTVCEPPNEPRWQKKLPGRGTRSRFTWADGPSWFHLDRRGDHIAVERPVKNSKSDLKRSHAVFGCRLPQAAERLPHPAAQEPVRVHPPQLHHGHLVQDGDDPAHHHLGPRCLHQRGAPADWFCFNIFLPNFWCFFLFFFGSRMRWSAGCCSCWRATCGWPITCGCSVRVSTCTGWSRPPSPSRRVSSSSTYSVGVRSFRLADWPKSRKWIGQKKNKNKKKKDKQKTALSRGTRSGMTFHSSCHGDAQSAASTTGPMKTARSERGKRRSSGNRRWRSASLLFRRWKKEEETR